MLSEVRCCGFVPLATSGGVLYTSREEYFDCACCSLLSHQVSFSFTDRAFGAAWYSNEVSRVPPYTFHPTVGGYILLTNQDIAF